VFYGVIGYIKEYDIKDALLYKHLTNIRYSKFEKNHFLWSYLFPDGKGGSKTI
jgi:hypothetical protein